MDNPNLKIWDSLSSVDRKFTKKISGKSYKGDSPNPTYVIKKITEALGPIGQDWGFNVVKETVRQGKPHQILIEETTEMWPSTGDETPRAKSKHKRYEILREEMHQIEIQFWFNVGGEQRTFSAIGGTPMLYLAKSGNWMHDEDAAKKSLTDAYTKGASWLGACADIFLGLFDDKYSGGDTSEPAPDTKQPAAKPMSQSGLSTSTADEGF